MTFPTNAEGKITIEANPGGSDKQLQYNNSGAFGGAVNVDINGGTLNLKETTVPSVPTNGHKLFNRTLAGRNMPAFIGPSGLDSLLQAGLHGNSVSFVAPSSTTSAPTQIGITLTTATTISAVFTAESTNFRASTMRKRFQSAATAASVTGMRTAYAQWFRGSAPGYGGFFFRAQFGTQTNINGSQLFMGLCASTGALATTAGAVSALLNMCGMGYDTTDANTGNWQFYRNDGTGTATKVDLGANAVRNTTHGFDLVMFNPPNSNTLFVTIKNITTDTIVLDTSYTTDLPAVNVGMAFKAETNNGAVASAQNIEVSKVYIESDY